MFKLKNITPDNKVSDLENLLKIIDSINIDINPKTNIVSFDEKFDETKKISTAADVKEMMQYIAYLISEFDFGDEINLNMPSIDEIARLFWFKRDLWDKLNNLLEFKNPYLKTESMILFDKLHAKFCINNPGSFEWLLFVTIYNTTKYYNDNKNNSRELQLEWIISSLKWSHFPSRMNDEYKQLVLDTCKYILYIICYHEDYKHMDVNYESLKKVAYEFVEDSLSGKISLLKINKIPGKFDVYRDKISKKIKDKEEFQELFMNVATLSFKEKQ